MLEPVELASFFEDYECEQSVKIAHRSDFTSARLVWHGRQDNLRRSRIVWLDEMSDADWVLDRMMRVVIDTNRVHFGFDLDRFDEKMQVAQYTAEDASHFDWHIDIGDGKFAARRKLSVAVQLSASATYGGEDLELNSSGRTRRASRRIGNGVLFTNFVR